MIYVEHLISKNQWQKKWWHTCTTSQCTNKAKISLIQVLTSCFGDIMKSQRLFLKLHYTNNWHWFGQNVVNSMLYVNTSKIPRMYTESEEIPGMHLSSLPRLVSTHNAMCCNVTTKTQPGICQWSVMKKKNLAITADLREVHSG